MPCPYGSSDPGLAVETGEFRRRSPGWARDVCHNDSVTRGLAWRLGLIGSAALLLAVRWPAGVVERSYARSVYPQIQSIVTNPPFSLAREFVKACRLCDPDYLALLLPVSALTGTQEWRPVWSEHPPTGMLFLCARPKFGGPGNDRLGTFWAIWESCEPRLAVKWR